MSRPWEGSLSGESRTEIPLGLDSGNLVGDSGRKLAAQGAMRLKSMMPLRGDLMRLSRWPRAATLFPEAPCMNRRRFDSE